MKTVTVRRTFENEGQIVRPARGDADPVRITVSETRARQLLKSGLVDEPEDAPEPTAAELEELAVRGFASATVDSSDSHVITLRVRTSRQADAVRGMLRDLAEKAKAHVASRREAGDLLGEDEGAASVLFADNRSDEERAAIVASDAEQMASDLEASRQAAAAATSAPSDPGAATPVPEGGPESGDNFRRAGVGDGEDAGGTTTGTTSAAEPVTTETAGAAVTPTRADPPAPTEGRRPRGNRTSGAAS